MRGLAFLLFVFFAVASYAAYCDEQDRQRKDWDMVCRTIERQTRQDAEERRAIRNKQRKKGRNHAQHTKKGKQAGATSGIGEVTPSRHGLDPLAR